MITGLDIRKLLRPLRYKIFLIVARGILTNIDTSKKTVLIQGTFLNGETITDIEQLQNYGFDSYPSVSDNSEVIALFPNGERNKGIIISVHNREERDSNIPTLSEGDVSLWDKNGNYIHLSIDGIKVKDKNDNIITLNSDGIKLEDANGNTVEMKSSEVDINSGNLTVAQ